MILYSKQMVIDALEEVCKKFVMTQKLSISTVKYLSQQHTYLVTLTDESRHTVAPSLIKKYIESLGEKGALEIAGHLMHSIELEQSIYNMPSGGKGDDCWEGDMRDVTEYLEKRDENE